MSIHYQKRQEEYNRIIADINRAKSNYEPIKRRFEKETSEMPTGFIESGFRDLVLMSTDGKRKVFTSGPANGIETSRELVQTFEEPRQALCQLIGLCLEAKKLNEPGILFEVLGFINSELLLRVVADQLFTSYLVTIEKQRQLRESYD